MTAGVCGALVGNPVEVVLIRMCVDGHLPVEQRRNYKNVFHALYHIVKFEGATTLYRVSDIWRITFTLRGLRQKRDSVKC
ncbi:hypothetical protein NECAME_13171, partial [Necator americanus]